MMALEIAAGIVFGSMALLADGLHMGSHTVALGINAFAYVYARRHAHDPRYSFGTGKVNALGGLTGAVLLAVFSLLMAVQSVERLIHPVSIAFENAIAVAVVGLVVNGVSILILGGGGGGAHDHGGGAAGRHHHHHHHDHNLRSAYLHVLADAYTSVLAIAALLAARFFGAVWMDPLMGIVGAVMISRWSFGLFRGAGHVLLDRQGPEEIATRIRESVERHDDNRVADLHLWSVGPGQYAAIIAVVASNPGPVEHYRSLLPADLGLAHVTFELHRCSSAETSGALAGDPSGC
jgi:cation diffusion facilitator family transporter